MWGERESPCRFIGKVIFYARCGTVRAIAADRRRRRGNCVKILLPETEPQGLERSGEQTAPENRKQRVRGESSANHVGRRTPIPKLPARGSRPKAENKGFAGSRARTMPTGGPPIPKLPARGSRPKTENKGFAGSRARTMPAGGPPIPKFPARGSRPKTENKGFAGSRARTMPAGGPPFAYWKPPPHAGPEGPSHFRRAHPTFGGPQQKNAGRPPGVFPYPINPVILTIPADSGRFPRILPGTLSAVEALLRCPLRGWLPHSAEASDRAGTSAGGTNRCGRSARN